jgi:hypothetical protein
LLTSHGDVVPKTSLEQLIVPNDSGLFPDLQDPAVTVTTTQDISKLDDHDPSSPNDHSNDLAEDVQGNNEGEILTVCPHENSADTDHSGDAPLRDISTTTVHANPVSVRRSINTIKHRPELLSTFTHVLPADELLLRDLFHTSPRLLGSPSLSRPLAQDDQEAQVIKNI